MLGITPLFLKAGFFQSVHSRLRRVVSVGVVTAAESDTAQPTQICRACRDGGKLT